MAYTASFLDTTRLHPLFIRGMRRMRSSLDAAVMRHANRLLLLNSTSTSDSSGVPRMLEEDSEVAEPSGPAGQVKLSEQEWGK